MYERVKRVELVDYDAMLKRRYAKSFCGATSISKSRAVEFDFPDE